MTDSDGDGDAEASAQACEYTGPDAPVLAANVCHGSAGSWPS